MNIALRRGLLLLCLSCAFASQALTQEPLRFPLDGILKLSDLESRVMSGGVWGAGLPGKPSYNGRHVHAGIDLRANLGDAIYAIAPGVVEKTSDVPHGGYGPGWTPGGVMIVRSVLPPQIPCLIIYGHTQNHKVHGGEAVVAGQALAEVGPWLAQEGGPHLHLTIRLGELPRFGWGTPTLTGGVVREGAESAGSEDDLLRLGYRDPIFVFRSGCVTPPMPEEDTGRRQFAALEQVYMAALAQASPALAPLRPCSEPCLQSREPRLWGTSWVRTYQRSDGEEGALVWPEGTQRLVWVGGPLWKAYVANGGIARLGPPLREEYAWGAARAQSFEKALLVVEPTGPPRLIFRSPPAL